MKELIEQATKWISEQDVKGCITGSSMLGYFEGQDVDLFVYDDKSFTKILFAMYYNDMFTILDPIEKWKFDQHISKNYDNLKKFGLTTIKFMYNLSIPINIIIKKNTKDIFSVLSTFDLDIIAIGYDIETKQTLDLSQHLPDNKATWNRWNTAYYDPELWQISRILRQLERVFKYHKRGYNTDNVILKYIELIDKIQNFTNIFNSDNFSAKLIIKKKNTKIIKQICEKWLETHEITDKEIELLKVKIKEI